MATPRARPSATVDRPELVWMLVVAGMAAAAFATTVSSRVALGDAPESMAGVRSLGIVHAPGYPAYVAAARAFTLLVPVGPLALRVNVFSALCSVLAVVGTFRIARRLGASREGAAVGALALAFGTSFWFYAGFAKHDAFSTLLMVAATLLVVEWDARGDVRLLVAAGAVLGLTVGASWQLGALTAVGLAVLVAGHRGRKGRLSLAVVAAPVVAGLVVAAGVLGYALVRARADPAVNWGEATTPGRLADLVLMKDFGTVSKRLVKVATGSPDNAKQPVAGAGAGPGQRLASYPTLLARELGAGALAVAAVGCWASWRRRFPRRHAAFLTASFASGVVLTAAFIGPGGVHGFETSVIVGGFLAGIFLVVALWVALGVDALVELAGRREWKRAVLGVAAAAVVVPSAVVHHDVASHRQPPFADQYAANVFASLPPGAAILTRGGELTFALRYRQVVAGERRDVEVLAADTLATSPWYREEVARRGDVSVPRLGTRGEEIAAVVQQLRPRRPVYLDLLTAEELRNRLGYRAAGLVAEVVDGVGAQVGGRPADGERLFAGVYRTDGVYTSPARTRWPNRFLLSSYLRAHLELARAYNQLVQWDALEAQARLALEVRPGDPTALGILRALSDARARPAG